VYYSLSVFCIEGIPLCNGHTSGAYCTDHLKQKVSYKQYFIHHL